MASTWSLCCNKLLEPLLMNAQAADLGVHAFPVLRKPAIRIPLAPELSGVRGNLRQTCPGSSVWTPVRPPVRLAV
jgi:hypothetical protein